MTIPTWLRTQCVLTAAIALLAPAANAALVSVHATFQDLGGGTDARADYFTVQNLSDPGIIITRVTYNMIPAANHLVLDTLDGASPDYFYGDGTGSSLRAVNPGPVGMSVPTTMHQNIWEEAQTFSLYFDHFDSGESFTFLVDVDSIVSAFVSGSSFQGVNFQVWVSDGDGRSAHAGNSFLWTPGSAFGSANAHVRTQLQALPVPPAIWLMFSALLGMRLAGKRAVKAATTSE